MKILLNFIIALVLNISLINLAQANANGRCVSCEQDCRRAFPLGSQVVFTNGITYSVGRVEPYSVTYNNRTRCECMVTSNTIMNQNRSVSTMNQNKIINCTRRSYLDNNRTPHFNYDDTFKPIVIIRD